MGIRFRTTETVMGVFPTFTIPSCQIVVFVRDCYEDRCPWHFPKRKSLRAWKRVQDFDAALKKEGWLVIRVWQHEVEQTPKLVAGRIAMIFRTMQKVLGKT